MVRMKRDAVGRSLREQRAGTPVTSGLNLCIVRKIWTNRAQVGGRKGSNDGSITGRLGVRVPSYTAVYHVATCGQGNNQDLNQES
jgi:hypothetical protein